MKIVGIFLKMHDRDRGVLWEIGYKQWPPLIVGLLKNLGVACAFRFLGEGGNSEAKLWSKIPEKMKIGVSFWRCMPEIGGTLRNWVPAVVPLNPGSGGGGDSNQGLIGATTPPPLLKTVRHYHNVTHNRGNRRKLLFRSLHSTWMT
jgi:hypothetical protein